MYNRFVLVPRTFGKVRLCLNLARVNSVLVRPIQWGPALNDISPRLVGVKYHTFINVSSGYQNLKLDEQSSYLTTFSVLLVDADIYDYHSMWH